MKKKPAWIGHVYHGSKSAQAPKGDDDWDSMPRGWIHPDGRFFRTKHHWNAISLHLGGKKGADDSDNGERSAHKAYSQGWISVGHGGVLNAVGHRNVFEARGHPALVTLRKLLSKVPHFSLRVEKQMGRLNPATGKHEDFDVKEYDLDVFIRHGRLKPS